MPFSPRSPAGVPPKEKYHYNKALQDLMRMIQNSNCPDNVNDLSYDSSQLDIAGEHLDDQAVHPVQDVSAHLYTETDVTLPSHLVANTYTEPSLESSVAVKQNPRKPRSNVLKGPTVLPSEVHGIYDELMGIYQKLQEERVSQQEYSIQLKKREQNLQEKEEMLMKHQLMLGKIKGVEEVVHAKFRMMKEQHDAEVKQVSDTLKEKIKENKRLKSSFDTLKEMNDTLKKQLNEVSEQNKKLETQARKVQARLENLQKKHAFLTAQKCRPVLHVSNDQKPPKAERTCPPSKSKIPNSAQVYDLVTILMDWLSELQGSRSISEEYENKEKALCTNKLPPNYAQEKCAKVLPVVVEQFQWMPLVNHKIHLAFIKFIYWTLRQMENSTQLTMTSTLRRIGEETFKGTVVHPTPSSSFGNIADNKQKTAAFFKSNHFPLRFVSTLVVLKTVTQVDYLAQALDSLCMDLKSDEGRCLFLEYQAVTIILNLLGVSNRGLVSSVLDILLQLSMETRFAQPFQESCSNEAFFKTCASLLRDPKIHVPALEKLSIVLQKLSKVRSNKKYFELFNIPSIIQEMQRSASPDRAFLIINLNSILFHLGSSKANSLSSNMSPDH
ncbi:coiled-coil domain-containing protein 138 [Spea bombifrons]|uniref:coiled-coil domain-containing protein 138 n=1 Tax=Spea bombifrons TaxID=233779 RepID=UPI00234AD879|nr:coiled-coil domain-containing protein 138 [Spea bombifrons]